MKTIKNQKKICFGYAFFVALLVFSFSVAAQITALCDAANPCEARGSITPGVNSLVPLVWRGSANVERDGSVISDSGRFTTTENIPLGQVAVPIRENLMANAIGAPVRFNVNESLSVPANVSSRAAMLGATQIQFSRTFSYEGLAVAASIIINLNRPSPGSSLSIPEGAEPGSTALGITRVNLGFSTGAQAEVVANNQVLRAIATINFDRAGMLDAVWEVATPASNSGQAIYQPIQNVRQYLAASRQVALRSPALPTDISGIYRLRFRILNPELDQAPIEIRYQVNESTARGFPSQLIDNVQPGSGQEINARTEFSWPIQLSAQAYQLEIYEANEITKPLTGLLLKGKQTSSLLSYSVLNRLEPGKQYFWRVIAIGTDGGIIAASELKAINMKK